LGGDTFIEFVVSPPVVHKKVPPGRLGTAVKVATCPKHIITGAMVIIGTGFTVTVPEAWAEHPVIVYVTL
jgi:hypothetical protein